MKTELVHESLSILAIICAQQMRTECHVWEIQEDLSVLYLVTGIMTSFVSCLNVLTPVWFRMELVGVVSYSHHHQTDKRMLVPTVYAKITNKVEAWIRAVAPTVKDKRGCDLI